MTPQPRLRFLAGVIPLLALLFAAPNAARGQAAAPLPTELAPEARTRLAEAAGDTRLAPWQRDMMLRMARTGTTATMDSSAAGPGVAGAADDAGKQPIRPTRSGHTAIYDPVRERMVVFGGWDGASALNDVWTLSLTGAPAWAQLTTRGAPPSPRWAHSAIYDPVRDRMLVCGGASNAGTAGDVWALSLAGAPAWTQLAPSGVPPYSLWAHSAIYDPVRDCMVVFGDWLGLSKDVWVLSLAGSPAWTQVTPSGTPPSTLYGHSAIYDPVRDRMVVFGGFLDYGSAFNDVWTLSLSGAPAWTQLAPSGPQPGARLFHSAIYDPVRDRMVVFDGSPGTFNLDDVWALSLAGTPAWTQLTPSGTSPSPRNSHSAIYDPAGDRMIVFGGYNGYFLDDAWTLSLADAPAWTQLNPSSPADTPVWTQLAPSGNTFGPSGRSFHSAIYDPVRDRMIVFGGGGPSYSRTNDVWMLSLTSAPAWTQLTPSGTSPSPRSGHSAIYDPVRDRVVVFGGYTGPANVCSNEVWALSLAGTPAWAQLAPSGTPPAPRGSHSAVYDPVRDRMEVFGGGTESSVDLNDTWVLSLAGTPEWTKLTPFSALPGATRNHSAIYDPVRDRMVVFGGYNWSGSDGSGMVWALSLSGTLAWTQVTPSGTSPSERYSHSAIYDPVRDRMVVFGGLSGYSNGGSYFNNAWALSLAGAPTWTQLTPSGTPPSGRMGHRGVYDPLRDQVVIFGGYNYYENDSYQNYFNDLWTLAWNTTAAVGDPGVPPLVSGLRAPAPNPTRGTTAVTYALARAGRVQLGVYDVGGRLVRQLVEGERRAGTETVVWNGTAESGASVRAGVYFVRLAGPGLRETRRVILLR